MLNFRVNYARSHNEITTIWVTGRTTENEYGPNTAILLERKGFRKIKDFPMGNAMTQALLELPKPYFIR